MSKAVFIRGHQVYLKKSDVPIPCPAGSADHDRSEFEPSHLRYLEDNYIVERERVHQPVAQQPIPQSVHQPVHQPKKAPVPVEEFVSAVPPELRSTPAKVKPGKKAGIKRTGANVPETPEVLYQETSEYAPKELNPGVYDAGETLEVTTITPIAPQPTAPPHFQKDMVPPAVMYFNDVKDMAPLFNRNPNVGGGLGANQPMGVPAERGPTFATPKPGIVNTRMNDDPD